MKRPLAVLIGKRQRIKQVVLAPARLILPQTLAAASPAFR